MGYDVGLTFDVFQLRNLLSGVFITVEYLQE